VVSVGEPHDVPTASELLEAVREWIERDVMSATDGRLRFHARVAANVIAIVERELAVGAEQAVAHRERLARLGVESDADLATRIRNGQFGDRAEELRTLLRESVEDKLRVANPKYLER
jgi:hypothetical protein